MNSLTPVAGWRRICGAPCNAVSSRCTTNRSISLRHDRVTAFEALVRWNSPTRGHILPDVFIALAEQTGLIVPIGEWVLRTACAEAAHWPDHVRVAVNLSAVQFKNKRLAATVRGILEDTSLPARRLELEITETALLQDTEAVMTMLRDLHDLGVRVAMDDFGTGYSSLSYLHRFPFDAIKIDRSFVSDLRVAPSDAVSSRQADGALSDVARSAAMIVRSITVLGENLGISTTAEGVETIEQFTQLRQQGCSEAQGYFISRPRPAADIEVLRQQTGHHIAGDRWAPVNSRQRSPWNIRTRHEVRGFRIRASRGRGDLRPRLTIDAEFRDELHCAQIRNPDDRDRVERRVCHGVMHRHSVLFTERRARRGRAISIPRQFLPWRRRQGASALSGQAEYPAFKG